MPLSRVGLSRSKSIRCQGYSHGVVKVNVMVIVEVVKAIYSSKLLESQGQVYGIYIEKKKP